MDELPSKSPSSSTELVKTKVFEIDNNIAGALSYVPFCPANIIFSAVWVATEPKSNRFLRVHAIQSLAINAVYVGICILVWLSTMVLGIIPFLGFLAVFASLFGFAASCVYIFGNIYMMYCAYKGKSVTIPYVTAIAEDNA